MADANSKQNTPRSTTEAIERHLNGERVTTEYVMIAGRKFKRATVEFDEPVPPGALPFLGEIS